MHDEVKAEFDQENAQSAEYLKVVEKLAKPGWEVLNESNERRVIKTHLPFSLLPPNLLTAGCKVSRNFPFSSDIYNFF